MNIRFCNKKFTPELLLINFCLLTNALGLLGDNPIRIHQYVN